MQRVAQAVGEPSGDLADFAQVALLLEPAVLAGQLAQSRRHAVEGAERLAQLGGAGPFVDGEAELAVADRDRRPRQADQRRRDPVGEQGGGQEAGQQQQERAEEHLALEAGQLLLEPEPRDRHLGGEARAAQLERALGAVAEPYHQGLGLLARDRGAGAGLAAAARAGSVAEVVGVARAPGRRIAGRRRPAGRGRAPPHDPPHHVALRPLGRTALLGDLDPVVDPGRAAGQAQGPEMQDLDRPRPGARHAFAGRPDLGQRAGDRCADVERHHVELGLELARQRTHQKTMGADQEGDQGAEDQEKADSQRHLGPPLYFASKEHAGGARCAEGATVARSRHVDPLRNQRPRPHRPLPDPYRRNPPRARAGGGQRSRRRRPAGAPLRRDSVHGAFARPVLAVGEDQLLIAGRAIPVSHQADPAAIPWPEDLAVVVEATGKNTGRAQAARHLRAAGPRQVVVSAVAEDADVMLCLGINQGDYDPRRHQVISNASCTTNCLALLLKVLHRSFGVERAMMNEVHSYTANQSLVDGGHEDLRRGRAAAINIIPTYSAAPGACEKLLPELRGRLQGQAVRVPTPDVALLDLVAELARPADTAALHAAFAEAAGGELRGLLALSDEMLVSSDFIGDPHSAVVDTTLTQQVGGRLVRVMAWYDNEWGYAQRLADLLLFLGAQR